ncbi:MAG: glycosyl hydrolase [Cyclobacteriaceae bacterium]
MPNYPIKSFGLFITLCWLSSIIAVAQSGSPLAQAAQGLKLRSIGPALMGGRIADIAVNPQDKSNWYIAVGSGGVWKTSNSGITWTPVFDEQSSYSIGTVSIDPNNTDVVWVGTGENVSGRHVGWGDGVYKSQDAGATWQQMGLQTSEHIGRILIDPRNSDVVLVAAEGPLWAAGGERGVYRTTDGGKSWQAVLQIDKNTGVTDIEFDPSNPDVLYAAAYQRRRHTWSLVSGGPQSGIYKSADNGITWKQVTTGLPKADVGKIGLAVTPADPALVYATIEADDKHKGFYRSTNRGESWEKRDSYISGGTGPHYYQEIEASPQDSDLIYQMDVFLHVTRDGGASFDYLGTGREKHSDNHALWIDPDKGKHLLAGTDAGLFETFDEGTTWRHFPNLPVAQFYKIALDNAEPFYNIVAGAQDLGTLIGPSRTRNVEGVRNQDWYVPLGADGYDAAFDPTDPNTVYMEIQGGSLHRLDRQTEEVMDIRPQPSPEDPPERWNWDSPILVSPHNSDRLYFGSQRVWRSENQGNAWTPISGDLTTNTNRYELQVMGRVQSVDARYDNGAMSLYATLTSIAESPITEGLLYTGSDDGLIHVSDDGGTNWRKSQSLPKVPARSFINDIEASHHNANTVFAIADAHKLGNFNSYIFMSTDQGKSWSSIAGDLPTGTIAWVIKQDHKDPNLLFLGTEYGIYFTVNKGVNWIKLDGGVPTISFRDLELHERDDDLVGATFGRGLYVLDDYAPLRAMSQTVSDKVNTLFAVRDAWWYHPNVPMQAKEMPTLGSTSYVADNPPFGAVFTYYIDELPQTAKTKRQAKEKTLNAQETNVPFPGWDQLSEEGLEEAPGVMLRIQNERGESVRWIEGAAKSGVSRTSWDLRLAAPHPIDLSEPAFQPPWSGSPMGPLVPPGTYSVALFVIDNGELKPQGAPQRFEVKPVHPIASADLQAIAAFQEQTSELYRKIAGKSQKMSEASYQLRYINAALKETGKASPELYATLKALRVSLADLRSQLTGDRTPRQWNESTVPSIMSRVRQVMNGHWDTTQLPTATQRRNIEIAEGGFETFQSSFETFFNDLTNYEKTLENAGAPWTPNRRGE